MFGCRPRHLHIKRAGDGARHKKGTHWRCRWFLAVHVHNKPLVACMRAQEGKMQGTGKVVVGTGRARTVGVEREGDNKPKPLMKETGGGL